MNKSQIYFKKIAVFACLILSAFTFVSAIKAQTNGVDSSFNPTFSKDSPSSGFVLRTDGKILIYGGFQVVNNAIKNQIALLNPDGSLDNSFDCASCDFNIGSALFQPDGKIIIAGSIYSSVTQSSATRIRRLNADGSLDTSFNSSLNAANANLVNTGASVSAIQPDGKILVLVGGSMSGYFQVSLYRLNADGTTDSTFTTIAFAPGRNLYESVKKIVLLPNGKILTDTYTASYGTGGNLKLFNSDGSPDSGFAPPVFSGRNAGITSNRYLINDIEVLPDGSLIVGGDFLSVNGISRVNIAKLQPAGNVDLNFVPANPFQTTSPYFEPAAGVEVYSNGKILVSTGVLDGSGVGPSGTTNRFIQFNADGSLDSSFTSPSNLVLIKQFKIDSSDSALVYGTFTENGEMTDKFARLAQNGAISSFLNINFGVGASITALAIQPDGKVIAAGSFIYVNGTPRKILARVNPDGSFDPTFNFGGISDSAITKIVVQPDGKILLAGSFTLNNSSGYGIIRLNSDGSVDLTFLLSVSYVEVIALQPDGKILVGGTFTLADGQPRAGLARFNADGSTDTNFNPLFGSSTTIRALLVQSDGKILVGGNFNAVNGFARNNLVRLNADGSLDTSFNAATVSDISSNFVGVRQIRQQADGKYIVATDKITRLNNNGTQDATFQSSVTGLIYDFLVQPDGSIIVTGNLSGVTNASQYLFRLSPNGALDNSFLLIGANAEVRALISQADGKIIVGGDFSSIGGVTRLGIARLTVAPIRAQSTLFDFDGDGRADIAVFRPANGFWYQLRSQNNAFNAFQFGQASDQLAPADYDGDGRTDLAVFRDSVPGAGDKAYFYITSSSDNSFHPVQFGTQNDLPVSGDWDGDGKADLAVYRRAASVGGQSYFLYRPSSIANADFTAIAWGTAGDKPVVGDFDGDGKLDAAVFRPSNAVWYILKSSNNQVIQQPFGLATDIPAAADYDGDGVTNIAVFRPSNGYWYTSTNPQTNYGGVQFGQAGDVPAAADYDGDGKADEAVYRPATGAWYVRRSTAGFYGVQFGAADDRPVPHSFIR